MQIFQDFKIPEEKFISNYCDNLNFFQPQILLSHIISRNVNGNLLYDKNYNFHVMWPEATFDVMEKTIATFNEIEQYHQIMSKNTTQTKTNFSHKTNEVLEMID